MIATFDAWMARHPLAYGSLVALAACLVLALFIDLPLLVALQSESWRAVKPAFRLIGQLGKAEGFVLISILVYLGALFAAWRLRGQPVAAWYRWLARHCLLYLAALLASTAVTNPLKYLVARQRPRLFLQEGSYGFGMPFDGFPVDSFPSGHTQVAFATAAVLALMAPRWAIAIFLLAGLVAASRLVTGWHYLSDVVASAFISVVIVRALARVLLDPAREWPGQSPLAWLRQRKAR
jgi:membrane-associated phospholipid phosphatase